MTQQNVEKIGDADCPECEKFHAVVHVLDKKVFDLHHQLQTAKEEIETLVARLRICMDVVDASEKDLAHHKLRADKLRGALERIASDPEMDAYADAALAERALQEDGEGL